MMDIEIPDNAKLVWAAEEIIRAVHGTCFHDQEWNAQGISIDCRSLQPGDLFIAMQGAIHDGHDYVAEAFASGAVAAVVMRQPAYVPAHVPLIYVQDTLNALEQLGLVGRTRTSARIVAVIGSGKIASKQRLEHMLGACGESYATDRSLNNDCIVPLSLARLPQHAYYGVFELSMNSPGELTMLSHRVKPHIALITSVATKHHEFFASPEMVADMQAEIFSGMSPQAVAILNRDNSHYGYLAAAAKAQGVKKILSYGHSVKADARLIADVATADGHKVAALMLGQRFDYCIAMDQELTEDAAVNSVGTLLTALLAGGDAAACTAALGITNTLYKLAV